MTEPRPDWDDARLKAAFAARAARGGPAPDGLAEAAMDRISERRPRRTPLWVAAAAGVALLIGVGGILGIRPSPRIPPTSASITPRSSDPVRSTPTPPKPDTLGDPIDVPSALTIRDGSDANGREIAVAGFLSPVPPVLCPLILGPRNPTRLQCPASFEWLMANPEVTMTARSGGPPKGPAFHPSFALVDAPDVPIAAGGAFEPIAVVLVGHFHDRRAALCPPARDGEPKCSDTFVVDRVAAVNGEERGVVTQLRNQRFDDATKKQVTEQPRDLADDVDALSLAQVTGGSVLSRQLVTLDQVTGLEPVLAKDEFVPYIGNPATLFWFVTVLDGAATPPVARTFALIDGSNWFGEVTATGMRMIERGAVSGPASSEQPAVASGDPAAFDAAPTSVLGIGVRDIASVMAARRADFNDLGRDEMAIKAWYVAPDPAARCDPLPAVHAPTPPCDAGRHWLLDRPDQFGHEPGQLRSNPDHWPPVLNPILPVDVPFDVPPTWRAGVVTPEPVVVLGHFVDNRVDTYAANVYFVIDSLAWSRDRSIGSIDSVVRLTAAATEDAGSVVARVDAVSPNRAVATWTTAVDAADFKDFVGWAARDATEFRSGAPVWIVRRLVHDETDGRSRLAIEWTYTSDNGNRVWWTETPDSPPDLATSIDLHDVDAHTDLIRVFDYDQQIESVATTAGLRWLSWTRVGPEPLIRLDVSRGRSNRELAIRWTGRACSPVWSIRVQTLTDGAVLIDPYTSGDDCKSDQARRQMLLTFDHPIDVDRIRTRDPCCG